MGKGGTYRLIVRPDSYYEVWMLEPTTLLMGSTTFVSPHNGGNREVPPVVLCHDDKGDTDLDYLTDRSERIVGTSFDQSDTDGDSVADGFEVLMGSDPTGGNAVFTGILATIRPTRGAFSDFVTTGNDLAVLGNGPHGLIFLILGRESDQSSSHLSIRLVQSEKQTCPEVCLSLPMLMRVLPCLTYQIRKPRQSNGDSPNHPPQMQ